MMIAVHKRLLLWPLLLVVLSAVFLVFYGYPDRIHVSNIENALNWRISGTAAKSKLQEPVPPPPAPPAAPQQDDDLEEKPTSKPEIESKPPSKLHTDPENNEETDIRASEASAASCTDDLRWLGSYNLSPEINYSSREIVTRPARKLNSRPLVTQITTPLFPDFNLLRPSVAKSFSYSSIANDSKCPAHLVLEVPYGPKPKTIDASHILFGIQTTVSRLRDTKKHIARWLTDTGAGLHVIIAYEEGKNVDDNEMRGIEADFRRDGMLLTVQHPIRKDDSFPQRYFSLVKVLYDAAKKQEKENGGKPTIKWVVIMDDDTFFPTMRRLLTMLERHDASKEFYIGGLSERWSAVQHYGLMGFGGAGVFLSMPLAAKLNSHYAKCHDEPLRTPAGDITLMDCVYGYTATKLTNIESLRQIDFYGDQSGFYESGRESLSLHHWKIGDSGKELAMDKMHYVADICDDCFLQRWQFPDGVVLSNGYSIVQYPLKSSGAQRQKSTRRRYANDAREARGMKKREDFDDIGIDLMMMETTWNEELVVTHSLGPVRPKLGESEKAQFRLLDSVIAWEKRDGWKEEIVKQIYVNKAKVKGGVDSVVVLKWRIWKDGEKQDMGGLKRSRIRGR